MRYVIGLGSNIAPQRHVPLMLRALLQLAPVLHVGRIIQTDPVGVAGEPFLNVPVSLICNVSPPALKSFCNALEIRLGRDRTDPASKRKSRTADLDLLFWVETSVTNIPPQLLPSEPYMRPILLELLGCLGLTTDAEPLPLPPGVVLKLDGLSFGKAPVTLSAQDGRLVAEALPLAR